MEGHARRTGLEVDFARPGPMPVRRIRAEFAFERGAVDEDAETASGAMSPHGVPVARPRPDSPAPGGGDVHLGLGVGHGMPDAVGHQVPAANLAR